MVDSATLAFGLFVSVAGMAFAAGGVIHFLSVRSKMNWYAYDDFPISVIFLTSFLVPTALLCLSVGWILARRGASRLVFPATSARVQAVLVRGLGALLFLPALLVAVAWLHDRAHIDTRVLDPARWADRFVIFTGLASVSCLVGAFAQLLRPSRIGPFLFGAALVLGTTVVYQFARLGWNSRPAFFSSFLLGVACAITLLLTAPWRRLAGVRS